MMMMMISNLIFVIFICFGFISCQLILAHRGDSGNYPEHTFAAYESAMSVGANFIEMDLQPTKDHEIVVVHSPNLAEITNVASLSMYQHFYKTVSIDSYTQSGWFVEDFNLFQLTSSDIRTYQRYPNTRKTTYDGLFRIITLKEAIQFINSTSVGIYIETKHPSYYRMNGLPLEEKILEILIQFQYIIPSSLLPNNSLVNSDSNVNLTVNPKKNKLYIESFESSSLKWFRERVSNIKLVQLMPADLSRLQNDTGYPFEAMTTLEGLLEVKSYCDTIGPYKLTLLSSPSTSTNLLINAKKVGLDVHAFTFRDDAIPWEGYTSTSEIDSYLDYGGIQGLFCDYPGTAMNALYRRKNMSIDNWVYGIVAVFIFLSVLLMFGVFVSYFVSKLWPVVNHSNIINNIKTPQQEQYKNFSNFRVNHE